MGVGPGGVAVWAGKPDKIGRRLFAYAAGPSGDLIAKVALPDDPWLPKEYDAIVALRAILEGKPMVAALPEVTRYEHPVMVQRVVPGKALTEIMLHGERRPAAAREAFRRAVIWLAAFHQATIIGPGRGWTHGDFKPSNVYLTRGSLAVIDWELAHAGWQEFDFWHLATYAGLNAAGANTWTAFSRVFLESTWIAEMIRDGLHLYASSATPLSDAFVGFRRYLDTVLARRAELGLSNEGYFLSEIRDRLDDRRPAVFLGA